MLQVNLDMEGVSPPSDRILDTVPLVVDESQIHRFQFYLFHALRVGMRDGQELYGLIHAVEAQFRLEAYRLGCELLLEGVPVLITASKQGYALWLNLRRSSVKHYTLLK